MHCSIIVNPFSSHAAAVFHLFAYIISTTVAMPTWILLRFRGTIGMHGNRTYIIASLALTVLV